MSNFQLEFEDVEENESYKDLIERVVNKCYEVEKLEYLNLYLNIVITTPKIIRELNNKYRNIDKETDVLSFPMFEKDELDEMVRESNESKKINEIRDILGDMVISEERVKEQAIEYGHSFERELSYMVVHSFYHIVGYDHMEEEDKKIMRAKEEYVLNLLNISRD